MKYTVNIRVEFDGQLTIEADEPMDASSLAESAVAEVLAYQGTTINPVLHNGLGMGKQITPSWSLELVAIDGYDMEKVQ